jgi:nucleoside-diphosphate-sugar epimerase
VSPINKYGHRKVVEESFFKNNFSVLIIRLSNIYGGNPETSGVLNAYYAGNLNYIETSENKSELLRDYVSITELFTAICDNLDFSNTEIINVSTGIGMTSTDFFSTLNLDISSVKRRFYNAKTVIKISIIDNFYKSKY